MVGLRAPVHSTLRKGGLGVLEKARHLVTRKWRPVNSASLLWLCQSCPGGSLYTMAAQGLCSHPDHHEVLMSPCPVPPLLCFGRPAPPLLCLGSLSSWDFWGSRLDLWLPWQPGSGPLNRGKTLGPTSAAWLFSLQNRVPMAPPVVPTPPPCT